MGVDTAPRLNVVSVEEPAARAGRKGILLVKTTTEEVYHRDSDCHHARNIPTILTC